MTDQHNNFSDTGLHHLPLRIRDAQNSDAAITKISYSTSKDDAPAKRLPEGLHFTPFRLRSPTESSMSSISSANVPDSATTRSLSTLASPISTSYASEVQEFLASHGIDESRPASRVCHHRQQPSNGTCSTFVNDEDDGAIPTGYPDLELKIQRLYGSPPVPEINQEHHALQPMSPPTEFTVKEEETATPVESPVAYEPEPECDASAQKWENESTASDDVSGDDADLVLGYVLQLVYGIDLKDASISPTMSHKLVLNFVQNIGQHIWQAPSDTELTHTMSTSSSSSTPSQQGTGRDSRGGGKRKKLGRRDDEGDEFSDGEGSGFLPLKRARPNPKDDENLRLSCPFRKRNPHRFNVRDHHSCAMTYFPKFAELRQHVVKQHKRDDPSAFICDRCNRDFITRKELRDHQRLPKQLMCDISDHDPESGIDSTTATKLLSRKRASGTSPEVQWREIWNILFPDDDDHEVKQFDFLPVIEHFELSNNYLISFEQLQASLRDKISNPATLETLATKFHQCFVETLERCTNEAQRMPYTNRSNKKNDVGRPQPAQSLIARKGRDILPRPDSGVVMDDGSEESGSIMGSGLGYRDSVRTIRGGPQRGSSQIPETVREVLPAVVTPGAFNNAIIRQTSMAPLDMAPSPMDPAAVHAWNSSVLYSHVGDVSSGLPNQYVQPGGMTPHPEYINWEMYQPAFGSMGNGYTEFNSQ
ncbi:hypothetical protein G7046_g2512 [Stylonectria norvegica]|nr:hypothetical protein G7046_g2512 [Stylonectria norvegica]